MQAIPHGSALTLPERPPATASLAAIWASGLAINLLNPKIVVFFMTFLPQFVRADDPAATMKLVTVGLLFIAIALCITVQMILAAGRVAAALRSRPQVVRAMGWIFASVFTATCCSAGRGEGARKRFPIPASGICATKCGASTFHSISTYLINIFHSILHPDSSTRSCAPACSRKFFPA